MSSIKDKITAVRAVVSNATNDDIVLVLQNNDNDVDKSIADFVEGRAEAILTEWRPAGPMKNKKKKKKKQQKKNKLDVETQLNLDTTTFDPKVDDITKPDKVEPTTDQSRAAETLKLLLTDAEPNPEPQLTLQANSKPPQPPINNPTTPQPTEGKPHLTHLYKAGHRSRTSSESSVKRSSKKLVKSNLVQESTTNGSVQETATFNQNKKSIEKATKDLQRCSASFGRYRSLLNDEINDSYKRIKQTFEEANNALQDREVELMRSLDKLKEEAFKLLEAREHRALELKRQTDRVANMKPHQVAELRGEIKHFVSDRKYDEEIGRTTRFIFNREIITDVIPALGEISGVKNSYSHKSRPRLTSDAMTMIATTTVDTVVAKATEDNKEKEKSLEKRESSDSLKLNSVDWSETPDQPLRESPASWANQPIVDEQKSLLQNNEKQQNGGDNGMKANPRLYPRPHGGTKHRNYGNRGRGRGTPLFNPPYRKPPNSESLFMNPLNGKDGVRSHGDGSQVNGARDGTRSNRRGSFKYRGDYRRNRNERPKQNFDKNDEKW
uniref:SPATS2-like protein n=1 Tax=Ciona intestinalis TaxID=7719 RepID=F6UTR1_CIOIN|nr:SPATS2-like protein [Ciona intestinalis]|eukprot:XP_002123251.1 SPATS2-like protein [Ciona intestinalis]